MITKQQIKDFYTTEGSIPSTTQERVYSKATSRKRKRAVEKMLAKEKVVSFLEIGCAEGMYCEFMLKYAERITGMDISLPKINRAGSANKIRYIEGDWDAIPFSNGGFDLILASECLEHSLDPSHVVKEVFRVAHRAIFSVPIKEPKLADPMHHHTGHIHAFRPDTFKELFKDYKINDEYLDEETGFMVLEVINK